MKHEEKYIPGYEGRYLVSNYGYVRKVGSDRRNYGTLNNRGYRQVHITDNAGKDRMFLVSRLVAQVYLPNPDGRTQVDHLDTDRDNNRADNLRWVWPRENAANYKTAIHRKEPRLFRRPRLGCLPARATYPDGRIVYANTLTEMAGRLGCSASTVSRCYHGDQPFFNGGVKIEPMPRYVQLLLEF